MAFGGCNIDAGESELPPLAPTNSPTSIETEGSEYCTSIPTPSDEADAGDAGACTSCGCELPVPEVSDEELAALLVELRAIDNPACTGGASPDSGSVDLDATVIEGPAFRVAQKGPVRAEDYEKCGLKIFEELWKQIPCDVAKQIKKNYDDAKCAKAIAGKDWNGVMKDCALKYICDIPAAKKTPMCVAIAAGKILEKCLAPLIDFSFGYIAPNVKAVIEGRKDNWHCVAFWEQEACRNCCLRRPTQCTKPGSDFPEPETFCANKPSDIFR